MACTVKNTYTVSNLERILSNFWKIRSLLNGHGQQLVGGSSMRTDLSPPTREVPLGWRAKDPPWPFWEIRHARLPFDGKAKARSMEDLHVSVIDVEIAMTATDSEGYPLLSPDDRDLLLRRYFEQWTLDELLEVYPYESRGAMHNRCRRAVRNLLLIMTLPKHE